MKKTFLTGLLSTMLFGSAKYFFDLLVATSTGAAKLTLEVKLLMVLFGTSSLVFLVLVVAVVFLMKDD